MPILPNDGCRLAWISVVCTVLGCMVTVACHEAQTGPPLPLAIAVTPTEVWSGGEVFVTSPVLEPLRLVPGIDYVLLLDGDTLDTWRPEFTTLSATIPPVYSGHYWLTLVLVDGRRDSARIRVIGENRPNRYIGGLIQAVGVGGSAALGAVEWATPWGYGLLDLEDGSLSAIPGLGSTGIGEPVPKIYAPGPSYRAGYVVVDMSIRDSASAPQVWQSGPTAADFRFDHVLDCQHLVAAGLPYTAAELSTGGCLLLDHAGAVFTNGIRVLADSGLVAGEFRFSPGAGWAIIVTRYRMQTFPEHLRAWPVFRGNGDLEYTLSGIAEVPGAAFSPDGDTLYAVVARPDPTTASLRWSADIFETATGRLLASLEVPDVVELIDIVLDPVLGRAYVAYRTEERFVRGEFTGCGMAVLDRGTWALSVGVPAREIWRSIGHGGAAQFDSATMQLHVMHFWAGDEQVKVHTYDTR
ncbi:MAG: hypothetical protein OER90_19760 [Gemmatimonadota bacterium]|nr:hypothetical protein [Gemmatimonadota bacterium]